MLITEFEKLTGQSESSKIKGKDLKNKTSRTLMYGYTIERKTFHVYLNTEGYIKCIVYGYDNDVEYTHVEDENGIEMEYLIPDKRAYPEACDFEFCNLLQSKGMSIPFTTYNENRKQELIYGNRF